MMEAWSRKILRLEPQLCWISEACLLVLKPVTAGANEYGQLGLGDYEDRGGNENEMGDFLPAVSLGTGMTATAISSGSEHACALLSNAQIKCWGECHVPPFPSRCYRDRRLRVPVRSATA